MYHVWEIWFLVCASDLNFGCVLHYMFSFTTYMYCKWRFCDTIYSWWLYFMLVIEASKFKLDFMWTNQSVCIYVYKNLAGWLYECGLLMPMWTTIIMPGVIPLAWLIAQIHSSYNPISATETKKEREIILQNLMKVWVECHKLGLGKVGKVKAEPIQCHGNSRLPLHVKRGILVKLQLELLCSVHHARWAMKKQERN